MPRIRTVKPDFFRHEGLQDLEQANPGKYPMLVFAGLWGHCDKAGTFEWRPRQLKLDILPFLDFDMAATLKLLADNGFVEHYEVDGKHYGHVPTFLEHQRISGKEAQEKEKFPKPTETQTGSNGEATGKQPRRQEGKGREEEGKEHGGQAANGSETLEAKVYRIGKSVLGKSSGGVITRLRRLPGMTDARAIELLEQATDKENPAEWIGAVLKNGDTDGQFAARQAHVMRGVEV